MALPQQQDDPLAAYRAQKQQSDPLAAYRASRQRQQQPDTGDIDLGSPSTRQQPAPTLRMNPVVVTKPEIPPPPAPGRMLDPGASVAQAGAKYVGDELQRGGAALVQQAKDFRDDAKLHGVGSAALRLGGSLAHGIVDPVLTLGKLMGSPEDEMADEFHLSDPMPVVHEADSSQTAVLARANAGEDSRDFGEIFQQSIFDFDVSP